MKFKDKLFKCNPLFHDLKGKSEFTDKELGVLKRKFIISFIYSRIAKFTDFYLKSIMFVFISLFCLYESVVDFKGDALSIIVLFLFMWIPIMSIIFTTLALMRHKVNNNLNYNLLTGSIHMGISKELCKCSNDRIVSKLLLKDFRNGITRLINCSNRTFNTTTHEIVKSRLDKMYKNNASVEYKVKSLDKKPVKEKFIHRDYKTCKRLYKSIGLNSNEDFEEVKDILSSSEIYKITIRKIK